MPLEVCVCVFWFLGVNSGEQFYRFENYATLSYVFPRCFGWCFAFVSAGITLVTRLR